jgi:hypothetical protein
VDLYSRDVQFESRLWPRFVIVLVFFLRIQEFLGSGLGTDRLNELFVVYLSLSRRMIGLYLNRPRLLLFTNKINKQTPRKKVRL